MMKRAMPLETVSELREALNVSRRRFELLGARLGFETETNGVKASAAIADIDAALAAPLDSAPAAASIGNSEGHAAYPDGELTDTAPLVEPDGLVSAQDPDVLLAGIKQFGLAPDGSDLRDLAAALTQLRQRLAELEQITDRLDADLATSDGHREAAEASLATEKDKLSLMDEAFAAVERERDEARALVKAIDAQREEYHWARKNAERERDEARATICTTDVRQELEQLTTRIAVAFHFVHDGQERNYALDETMKECGALIEASFVRIAGPYYNALAASEAKVLQLNDTLSLHMDILQRCANARHDAEAKVLALTTALKRIASSSARDMNTPHPEHCAGIARAALQTEGRADG